MTAAKLFPTLYKQDSKKRIQTWEILADGPHILTTEGLLDGKKSNHVVTVKDRKRSPTIEAQAELMAASKWNNKRKSYWESIFDAQKAGRELAQGGYAPMLAHTYSPSNSSFSFPCLIQPKLDGQRTIARKIGGEVTLWSRKGLPIDSVGHINRSLERIMQDGEIYDGELYNHGSDFNVSSGKIRATNGKHDTSEIDYWVYDMPRVIGNSGFMRESAPYADRIARVGATPLDATCFLAKSIVMTPTAVAKSFTDVQKYHDWAVELGFEGAILRNPNMPYENARSHNLLKYKMFFEKEYPIIGYAEGSGVLEGCVGSFCCALPDGGSFYAKLKTTNAELKRLFEHKELFAGKHLTVKYQILSAAGVPRFPVGLKIR